MASILLARESAAVGGDTLFVDTAAVWAGLSPGLQVQLQSLRGVHGRPSGVSEGLWKGGAVANFETLSRSELRSVAEVSHPVMRTHPETGQPHLFVNPTFTLGLQGVPPVQSAALLDGLYTKMYSTPEYACRFRWSDGACALWDNRACQHYACGDFWPQRRKMERVTVLDAAVEQRTPY
jgi:taurine dioxygenase